MKNHIPVEPKTVVFKSVLSSNEIQIPKIINTNELNLHGTDVLYPAPIDLAVDVEYFRSDKYRFVKKYIPQVMLVFYHS